MKSSKLWCSAEQSRIHVHLDRELRLISQKVFDKATAAKFPRLSIISPWGHLTFHPMAAEFPWEPLVSIPSQGFWKGISLPSDLVTAPRKYSVVLRRDSPSKQELCILLQLLCGDTDAKYLFSFPIHPYFLLLCLYYSSAKLCGQMFCTSCACERIP